MNRASSPTCTLAGQGGVDATLVAVQCSSGPGDSVPSGLVPQGASHRSRSVFNVGSIATVTDKSGRHDHKFERLRQIRWVRQTTEQRTERKIGDVDAEGQGVCGMGVLQVHHLASAQKHLLISLMRLSKLCCIWRGCRTEESFGKA
ncbi:hypothetical protein CORC01_13651 [Colletotrichum orchidophilum]|uniref:Uncharacterized protein n=1 Tax=Colletotrichum orchidophilum TaxID=1209926 RepID=A0A1G4APR5_9PEZI|nr:uncharacterized protein CORC01_13651 [Colletotrichum orchidophilum]OHE91063.1 hypothetical protein CORC01_13651 [Colletotrichum orchidophilum]